MKNRLLKKTAIYFIGNLSSKIMSALLIPIYAFYISAEDFGTYDFSQTLMGIISPIIVAAIWEAILRFMLSEDDDIKRKKVMSTAITFSLSMSTVFVILATIYVNFTNNSILFANQIILMIVLNTLVYIWQYSARGTANNKLFVISGIVSTTVNFIMVLILVVYLKLGLLGLYLAYNMGQLAIILILESRLKLITSLKVSDFDYGILKKMLFFSSPLVFNLISAWFISGFGRTIITLRLGNEANGVYSFANKFSILITVIGSVVTMAIIEEAILSLKNKQLDTEFYKTIQTLFLFFLGLITIAMPAINVFYIFISKTDYQSSIYFIPGLLLYAVFNTMASNIGSVFQAINKTSYQFITTLLGGIMTVIISLLFISTFGVMAVIIGQIIGAFVMLISRYIIINKFIEFKINWLPIVFLVGIFCIVSVITLNVTIFVNIIIELLCIVIIAYINKDIIMSTLKK